MKDHRNYRLRVNGVEMEPLNRSELYRVEDKLDNGQPLTKREKRGVKYVFSKLERMENDADSKRIQKEELLQRIKISIKVYVVVVPITLLLLYLFT